MTVIPIFMGPASSVPGRGAPDTDIVGVSTFGNALASAVDGSEKVAVPAGNIDSKQDSDGQPVNHAQ